ncbi:PilN domain-containing protein [Fusobacterium russii]|uniref:PilN domain-containing protein n=1 Tax=Fusobacterium russii TaxID=854 RepID=UPI00039ED453|nr:PilN domain-containing protein [Fusobacterium russii]
MIKNEFPLIYKDNINLALDNRAVLCLENFYFRIFKLKIENVINEEDRILKIEEHLEIIFPKYNSSDFILNYEFLSKNEEEEYLAVYLLNLTYLKNENILIDDSTYKFLSIIPSFFKVREFKAENNFYNFDVSPHSLVISKYSSNKLEDINSFHGEASFIIENSNERREISYYNVINSFLETVEKGYFIIFTGNKIEEQSLELKSKNYTFFDIEKINFRKYPNFLPLKIQRKNFLYFLNFKYLLSIFLLLILSFLLCFFLYYKINSSEEKLQNLESQSSLLEEENRNIREKLKELEDSKIELQNEKNKILKPSFKISEFLISLKYLLPENTKISSIEYDGQKTLSLIGLSQNLDSINLFLENIQNSKELKLENYDYILKTDSAIEFKLELIFQT